MQSIITGDIVNSQSVSYPDIWLAPLREILERIGPSGDVWEIYRGDNFQVSVEPEEALRTSLLIKSVIKKQNAKELDVRMAIGIGEEGRDDTRITESTGEAFVKSGRLLENLKKKKVHLAVHSSWNQFDEEINMMLKLALFIMNSWTPNAAETAELLILHPDTTQTKMARRLGIAQSSVNDRIKRGALYEIMELEKYYRARVRALLSENR